MLCASGAKNKQAPNKTATTTAVKPVLPPSLIPAPLSIYEVVLEVPASAPTVVATMMATGVNDPIIGVQLSGNPTTTEATFVFSDDIPGTGYYLELLASV